MSPRPHSPDGSCRLPHVIKAFAGQPLHAGSVVKYLDAHPAGIVNVFEGLENRDKVDVTKPRPLKVYVIGMEMLEVAAAGMIAGISSGSLAIAFTSRCSRTWGDPIRSMSRQVSAAVVSTSVSFGASGSSATTVPVASSTGTSCENRAAM